MVRLLVVGLMSLSALAQVSDTTPLAISDPGFVTFDAACSSAAAKGLTLMVTRKWPRLPTQTCGASIDFRYGGMLQPAAGQIITLKGNSNCPQLRQCYDLSLSGSSGVVFASAPSSFTPQNTGAKEDSVSDDTASMNLAMSVALANRIPLILPGGTFRVTAASAGKLLSVTIGGNNFSMIGAGSGATVISTATAGADLLTIEGDGNPVVTLKGFYLQGPDAATNPPCRSASSGNGLYLTGGRGAAIVHMDDIQAYGFCGSGKAGIWLDAFENGSVSNVIAQRDNIGMKWTTAPNQNILTTGLFGANRTYAMEIDGCQSSTVSNTTMQSNYGTALYLNSSAGCSFINDHFENNNTSKAAGNHSVFMDATGSVIRNNSFTGGTLSGPYADIYMKGNLQHATTGNFFSAIETGSGPIGYGMPMVIEDGPEIGDNYFFLQVAYGAGNTAGYKKINNTEGRFAGMEVTDILCGSYRANTNACYFPRIAPTYGTYKQVVTAYPLPNLGQMATFTDATVNTWGAYVTVGGGTYKVLCWFDGNGWSVMGK